MGGGRAKQFLELNGVPVIVRTLRKFEGAKAIDRVVVVLPSENVAEFLALAGRYGLTKITRVVPGGDCRAHSVWNGIRSLRPVETNVVAIHDGVRPFITPEEIDLTVAAADEHGAAIMIAPVSDTIKETRSGFVSKTVPRNTIGRALTPQCFRYRVIAEAFESAEVLDETVTDESCLVERLGKPIRAIEGSSINIKITMPEDLFIARAILEMQDKDL